LVVAGAAVVAAEVAALDAFVVVAPAVVPLEAAVVGDEPDLDELPQAATTRASRPPTSSVREVVRFTGGGAPCVVVS
jgi:hypothetical protein